MPEGQIGHTLHFGKSLVGLFHRGWWEIPEIMGASVMALIGITLTTAGLIRYYNADGDNREYKLVYMIMRPEDPRAKRMKNPVHTKL